MRTSAIFGSFAILAISFLCTSNGFLSKMPPSRNPVATTSFMADGKRFEEAMKAPYGVATELLSIVLERRAQAKDSSFEGLLSRLTPAYKEGRAQQQKRIEELIEDLRQYDNFYDPAESLLGPFYETLYWYTPGAEKSEEPIWEKVSLKTENIKGQQYFMSTDFSLGVINYAEIWDSFFHIRANGFFVPLSKPMKSNGSILSRTKFDSNVRACPDVYQVNATSGTLCLAGLSIPLPIEGSSNLVVLYADPRIRVFLSPIASASIVGNWEEAGLIVVQVRSDLVKGDELIDLR